MPTTNRNLTLLLATLAVVAATAPAQDTDDYFKQNCASCHTIGGGRLTGPDLKDVEARRQRDWIVRFIVDPQGMIESGDATAVQLLKEARGVVMPKAAGIDRARAEKIIDLVGAESKLDRSRFAGLALSDRAFIDEDRQVGRDLFLGRRSLASGGPACISCHSVGREPGLGGGRLGPDLSDAYTRLEGRKALGNWLAAPATPTMAPVYKVHPIDEDEILPLLAYLEQSAKSGAPRVQDAGIEFPLAGVVLAAAGLFLFEFIWRRRFTGVRARLVKGQR